MPRRTSAPAWLALLAGGAAALSAAPGVRRLTRVVDRVEDLESVTEAPRFIDATGVPTWCVDEAWAALADVPRAGAKRAAVAGVDEDHAFVVEDALSRNECAALVEAAEALGLQEFDAGKNKHAALQIVAPATLEQALAGRIGAFLPRAVNGDRFANALSARLRFYRYAADGEQTFSAHLDAGFPAGGADGDALVLDAFEGQFVSRYSALFYLTDDFAGGETAFFAPQTGDRLGAVQPNAGSCLLIRQALDDEMEDARSTWPSHAGLPLKATNGAKPKYIIRADCLYAVFDRHAPKVRRAFTPRSPVFNDDFLRKVEPLYSPHMGVENASPLLYSLVRFLKPQRVVEVGAGYSSIWILRALADNDSELERARSLQRRGECELLDWPWCTSLPEAFLAGPHSSLRCIDNCEHQTTTALGVVGAAEALGVGNKLEFIKGDAFDLRFEADAFDLFWLDFGVGDRVADFVRSVFPAIRAGGHLVCHSTVTNEVTREWLEAVRAGAREAVTGIPPGEVHHISFLEPHKHFQNAVTILQRRPPGFAEPVFSQRA
ncbi:hypothetical protein M885DRAFT_515154 [Pelagophyceae sp. CCMP2097]|nr:hypothetical protein M885DRAFT_515154 [Pelagophyceae sp. CCMP2097]